MSTLLHGEDIALQQSFLSIINRAVKKPKPQELNNNIREIERYLSDPHFRVNYEINGGSPLAKATSNWEVLEKLLELGSPDLNFRTPDGQTSIFSAVKSAQTDSLELLLQHGAAVDVVDNKGRTAISIAAEYDRVDHMKQLIQAGADINVEDENGWTPISFAISRNQNDSTKYLLSQKDINLSNHDTDGRTLAVIAAQGENVEGLRLLLDATITVSPRDRIEDSPLVWAILQMDTITARLILRADSRLVDHKVKGRTPLSIATEIGDIDMIKLLVELGANANPTEESIWPCLREFLFISYFPPEEFLRAVDSFAPGAPYDTKGQKPLLLAAQSHGLEILDFLLGANADINTRDTEGRTALTWAVSRELRDLVDLLLSKPGIDINCRDKNGQTPFALAARMGNVSILESLLKQGPDVNSEDDRQQTPLLLAVTNTCLAAVEFLLEIPEIDVHHMDDHGRTPFSFAAEKNSLLMMQALLDKQADPHKPDNQGYTGFWWFLQKRNQCLSSQQQPIFADWKPSSLKDLIYALPTPNKKDASGRDWLSWAASYGDEAIVRCFLRRGEEVNVNARDNIGGFLKTPLIWALEGEHNSVIGVLKDGDNISLHLLIKGIRVTGKEYCSRLMRALLQAGYNLNQTDMNGMTPLHIACQTDHNEIVSILINAKANLNCKDHTGKTPLQIALQAKSKTVVDTLLKASVNLNPVRSEEWFIGKKRAAWAQIIKKKGNEGFELKLENDIGVFSCAREVRLSLCRDTSVWSKLSEILNIKDLLGQEKYLKHAQRGFGNRIVTYIETEFPEESEKFHCPWGIAWISTQTTEGPAHEFISTLPNGSVPEDSAEFLRQFLKTLQQRWKEMCSYASREVEYLRSEQVREKGKSLNLVDRLAKNSQSRARLRQCLETHTEQLVEMVTANTLLDLGQKSSIREDIDEIEHTVTARLDHLEQAIRELLQIELAWISTNESASFKRLSWITFIYLPLMFVSSLFGMNVNLLKDYPDWRWYLLSSGLSLALTGTLWIASKFLYARNTSSSSKG